MEPPISIYRASVIFDINQPTLRKHMGDINAPKPVGTAKKNKTVVPLYDYQQMEEFIATIEYQPRNKGNFKVADYALAEGGDLRLAVQFYRIMGRVIKKY